MKETEAPSEIRSGEWRDAAHMTDYRVERLSDILVERATWVEGCPEITIVNDLVSAPGYIWFRFWLLEQEQIVEKYFYDKGVSVGMRVPVCMPFVTLQNDISALPLVLELWIAADEMVTVLSEQKFESMVQSGLISPVESEQGEFRIREMTLATAQKLFPPPIIRNFELQPDPEP